ncbi:MAG: hypothetical protein P1P82_15360 [Bacteroidales bacterium]|nr:hypothetical protein [Bacteroidales bacterium]MDT8430756.1 hypothetical protein [Bacteroidales bacterium]
MNCKKTRRAIITGKLTPEATEHIAECAACHELQEKVGITMAILDQEVTVPENLADRILSRREEPLPGTTRRIGLATFIQVAAAVCFGIFIGHQFGKYAGPVQRTASADPVQQYFKAHHFNLEHSDFRAPSFFNPNAHD